jgi:hypothetical protein
MVRRGTKLGVAAASLTGVALAMGVPSGAATPSSGTTPVDADGYTLSCSAVSGDLAFSPHLKTIMGSGTITEKWKVHLAGCSAGSPAGGAPVVITDGTISGTIAVADQGCEAVVAGSGTQGTLTAKFKTAPGTSPLTVKIATLDVSSARAVTDAAGNYQLDLGVTQTGAFSGTDGGTGDVIQLTGPSYLTVKGECTARAGLARVTFGDGSVQLG